MNVITLTGVSAALFILSACATTPDPVAPQMARAETTIELAERSGAREFATQALDRARTKLTSAKLAAQDGNDMLALRLAQEAELEAQLAVAEAESAEAEASLDEVRNGIQALRREIDQPK